MAEVVADGAHDGVDLVAKAAFEEVSAQMAVGFAMTNDGLDGGPTPELLFDLAVNAALLPGTIDPVGLRRIVADIALVHMSPLDLAPGKGLCFLEARSSGCDHSKDCRAGPWHGG